MRIRTGSNWNKRTRSNHRLSGHIACADQKTEDWKPVFEFAAYAFALAEAKRGWRIIDNKMPSAPRLESSPSTSSVEDGFEKQKREFQAIPQSTLEQYRGEFIASRNGVIVDHDNQLVTLSHRVREQYGSLPMYITRIGKALKMPTPFVMR